MTEITRQTVTLINQRNGQERYTRYNLGDVVEMIRKGKLKSGKPLGELTDMPRICFASAIKNEKGKRWTYLYNGLILLEINNLPDRKTAEEIRQEASLIDYTVLAFVGADGRSVKLVCQAAERNNWQNPEGYWQSEVEKFNLNAYAKFHYLYSTQLAIRVENIAPSLRTSCEMSHDEDIYFNPDCAIMMVSPDDQTAERLSRTVRQETSTAPALRPSRDSPPKPPAAMSIRPARPMPSRSVAWIKKRTLCLIASRCWPRTVMRAASRRPSPSG